MSDCRFGLSPVNYPDPDPELQLLYDVASESVIKPCIKNDNPLVD